MLHNDLPTPIQTRWIAIAGGACSGKTTLAKALREKLQWQLIPDFGREVFQEAIDAGKTVDELMSAAQSFQDQIAKRYLERYKKMNARNRVISDYGLPCVYAWYKAKNTRPHPDLIRGCDEWRYDKVFMLSPLPMEVDAVREEAVMLQKRVREEMTKAYRFFGYNVIHVPSFDAEPAVSISKRLDFILHHINRQGEALISEKTAREVA